MALELGSPAPAPARPRPRAALPSLALRREPKIGDGDRLFLTEQLALMLETGVSLHAALSSLRRQSANPALQRLLGELADEVAGGRPFSQALARHPEVFSRTYVNLVGASEQGGFMHEVLAQILRMEERRAALRSALLSAFTYPAFLLVFSVAVVVFVLTTVFPKFATLFGRIASELPWTTRVLMSVSDALVHQWPLLVAGTAVAGWLAVRWASSPAGSASLDRFKLAAPGIGGVFIELYLVHTLRVLSLSLANGVTIMDALAACRELIDNRLFRAELARVERAVEEGKGVTAAFLDADLLPMPVREMIATGDQTGRLAQVAGRLADFHEQALQKRLARLARLVEPLMLLVMGTLVGVLVASLILPIFKLAHAVH
jgi:type II secretory pathway component PulF